MNKLLACLFISLCCNSVFAQLTHVEAVGVTGQTVNLDNPQQMAISPDGKFIYVVVQNGTDGITVFSRNASTGKVTYSSEVAKGSTGVLINTPRGIAISKDGGFVYVSGGSDDALNVFSRDKTTGVLSIVETFQDDGQTGGTISTLDGAWGVSVSPDNKHVIVIANTGVQSGFTVFTRNTTDGTLTFLQDFRDDSASGTITNLNGPRWSTFSPDGEFVYVSAATSDALNIFSRETDPSSADFGKLTFVSDVVNSTTLDFLEEIVISDDNAFIYLAPRAANRAVWASRNTSTGAIGTLNFIDDSDAGITSLNGSEDWVLSTDNSLAFLAVASADMLTVFDRNAGTGALSFAQEFIDDGSSVGSSSTDFGLNNNEDVAVSPDGKHLYALGQFDDVVSLFSFDTPSAVPEIDLQQSGSIANGGSFDFGTVSPGTNSDMVFTIANTGATALYAYDVQTSGEFSIQTDIASSTVAASGSTTFTVRFSPSSNGAKTAELLLINTDVDEGAYTITLNGTGGTVVPTSATVAATVFLEGAYNGTNLNTTLNASIPTTQTYTNNGHAWAETAGAVPANAVDWVLVELREAGSAAAALNATKVGSAAGFLMNDGTIKATDGTSNLTISLSGNTGSDFFVVIYHRNHLPIMSANAISESSSIYAIDFTSASANTHQGTTGLASLSGAKFGMLAGDADGDGDVDATDLTTWRGQNGGQFSYNSTNGDFNLDGVINAVDRNNFQQKNATKTSQIPTT
ncbi:MAG: beta-propeller fold lactonase family protein [Roseivirga sp.]|nr:beta-propeller fold lactonase family protein [Roseivirga sp.]